MRRLIISGGLLLTFAVSLTAQKINQSVQVTNDYETRFADFKKSEPDLVLPDSLYAFDYSFDYSVLTPRIRVRMSSLHTMWRLCRRRVSMTETGCFSGPVPDILSVLGSMWCIRLL